ncbi:Hypothetical_protein [Hexamita inflata]|uniref:Hypothetical_protein n=1 Tax=Hexamita inflata TaxID=28002 RepID=A0AA86UCA9_9EUKA|nr:Hypothetical protein HINF_LOCUS37664 [Hexamita inflata]
MNENEQASTKKNIKEIRAESIKKKEEKETLRLEHSNIASQNFYEYKYKEKCLQLQQQLDEQQILITSLKQQLEVKNVEQTDQYMQTQDPVNDQIRQLQVNRKELQLAKQQLNKEKAAQLLITNKNLRILELQHEIEEQQHLLEIEKITLEQVTQELQNTKTVQQVTPQTTPQAQVKFKEPLEEIKEQHTYTDMEKKINALRYMRYGGKRYLQERQMQFQTTGAILPSLSSVKRYRREYLLDEDNYSANMGLEFDPNKFLNNVNTWKQTNHVPEQKDSEGNVKKIKAHIQMDAMYVNYQVCNINGVTVGTIKNHKGQELPIKYIFAYILVCEENYPPLPIFCQYSWDGKARDAQYQCYLQICKALEKYNFQADKLCHDSDTFFHSLMNMRWMQYSQIILITKNSTRIIYQTIQ